MFRIYIHKAASEQKPSWQEPSSGSNAELVIEKDSLDKNKWINIQCGFTQKTIYNISLYIEVNNDVTATNYLYLAHISVL